MLQNRRERKVRTIGGCVNEMVVKSFGRAKVRRGGGR